MLQGKELRDTCLGSATAGMVSRLMCHPLDTAKARLQGPDGGAFTSTWQVLRMTMERDGFRGLYRGIGAVLVGGSPGMCLYLTTYEATKDLFAENGVGAGAAAEGGNFVTHFWSGMLAEAVCCVVFVPVDVVKERLQVQQAPLHGVARQVSPGFDDGRMAGQRPYTGSADALRTILKTEGLRGIYKGYAATLGSFGPFAAFYFMFYEQAKASSKQLFGRHPIQLGGGGAATRASVESARGGGGVELPLAVTLANAAGAAAAASWLTNPLDIAKLRLQVQRGARASDGIFSRATSTAGKDAVRYSGMLDALGKIYRAGGLTGLFKGSGARMAFQAPSTAIAMATFERARDAWGSLLE